MNPIFLSLVVALAIAQLLLPRRISFVPLLISACHIGTIEFLGQLSLPRLLIIVGLSRAFVSGHLRFSLSNPIDRVFLVFSFIALATAGAHSQAGFNFYISNLGLILNVFGTYLYGRAYLQGTDWPRLLAIATVVVMLPLAVLLAAEKATARNYYSVIKITGEGTLVRDDRIRARGPFRHPILAGTAGAVTLPLCAMLWRHRRKLALAGIIASGAIVFSSSSSGPMATYIVTGGIIWFWKHRYRIPQVKFATVCAIIFLLIYMDRPIWYVMDKIDLVGGSTGWHRARLIDTALNHLDEWWLAGTDFTRHWMPTGVSWNPNHTDITNYYLHLGVIGGIWLTLALVTIIWLSFRVLGQHMALKHRMAGEEQFPLWCVGASLFGHALSFVSISYFDQMYVLFYLLVGGIGGLHSRDLKVIRGREEETSTARTGPSRQLSVIARASRIVGAKAI